jgi:hypothetical protein
MTAYNYLEVHMSKALGYSESHSSKGLIFAFCKQKHGLRVTRLNYCICEAPYWASAIHMQLTVSNSLCMFFYTNRPFACFA